ncbi:methyl-accepting chemotaxis protein [Asticcacaulis benevestitus]|uniref:Methyl-accepting chemotaxis protein n=1 Tax=Asticcacaulis benevestitus DSM 16100 = ATCC BAA-896 TaxID=1121022 RepID=V4PFP9_9CAUL|nr:methyl-accepting chemotaxis protein [Asticcacaulis benevestitus]ESQ92807.1 hypothetical protein ABENE_06815 [Asticcacaulis benevestitus DSM 16100 = ATCC BAA-896]
MLSLNNIKLRGKLALIVVALFVPIAILAGLFIEANLKDIQFSSKERDGANYFKAVWTAKGAMVTASLVKAEPSRFISEPVDLEGFATKYDKSMATQADYGAAKAALSSVGFPNQALNDSGAATDAVAKLSTLMAKVAEGSNLLLDPDFKTYYLIDAITVKLPALGDHMFNVTDRIGDYSRRATPLSFEEQVELYGKINEIKSQLYAAQDSLNSAYSNDHTGAVKTHMASTQQTFNQDIGSFITAASKATDALRANQSVDVTDLSAQAVKALKANRGMAYGVLDELHLLLQARISNLTANLWVMLGVAGLITLMALALAAYLVMEISGTLGNIVRVMKRLTENDFTVVLPSSQRRDEIGEMVSCVEVFKANAEEQIGVVTTDLKGQIAAISKAQAIIEFDMTGKILTANENFLTAIGYSLDDIKGQHHSMFVDPDYRNSTDYRLFWERLGRGEYDAGQYKRIARGGREIWLQASYNPIMDMNGKPFKVVKYATNITEAKIQAADFSGQLQAISKAQAVIEFDLTGKILTANDNFLAAIGYSLDEVKGQHHSMFVDPEYRNSTDYRLFWERLGRGEYDAGQYKRIARGGRELWLQASYNPIMDMNGKPFKVVKYATDVSIQVAAARALEDAVAQSKSVIDHAKTNDLTHRVDISGKSGEIAIMCEGINELLDSTSSIISDVTEASSNIKLATAEISAGTNDLSQRTEQQASNLQETAASMEQIASTIRQNADNAQEASKLAGNASKVATSGGKVVAQAVEAMSRIETSSQKISDIIGVIDEIAFQTNLLALNAAVEAARAGDAGKGFAVVAAEVRSLAQRSSGAAKDIKTLIAASGSEVKEGVKLVNDAGGALSEIVGSIQQVATIISEIAAASKEQSVGVEEINTAVSQMDEMTQQNSALVEENAASSRMLQDQAESMHQRMASFRVLGAPPQAAIAPRSLKPTTPIPAKPQPRPQVAQMRKVANGSAHRLQDDLRSAIESDADWAEF